MQGRKVVVTGAAGLMAGLVLPAFRERYELALLDLRTTDRDGNQIEGMQIVDLLGRNRDKYREHFQGVDAVVHCGFVRADDPDDADQRFAGTLTLYQGRLEGSRDIRRWRRR